MERPLSARGFWPTLLAVYLLLAVACTSSPSDSVDHHSGHDLDQISMDTPDNLLSDLDLNAPPDWRDSFDGALTEDLFDRSSVDSVDGVDDQLDAAAGDDLLADSEFPTDLQLKDTGLAGDSDANPTDILDIASTANPGSLTVSPAELVPGGSATIRYTGHLKDRHNLHLHYGFNGWNKVELADLLSTDTGGNLDYFKEAAMQPVEGGYQITISIPTDARALHFVLFSVDGSSRIWDNNQGDDYNRAIAFPYIGPYLTWNAETTPQTGVVVSFISGYPCQGKVLFGKASTNEQQISEAQPGEVHHLQLAGLAPNTTYRYVVQCGAQKSAEYTFRTAPVNPSSFSFAVFADMQDNGDNGRFATIATDLATNHPELAFLLIAGDMCWDDKPGHWWTFFDKGRALFSSRVVMPAPGNHDTPGVGSNTDTTHFERFFDLDPSSGSETYYRFDYGSATFLALNSERWDDFAKDGAQYKWAYQTLTGITDPNRWVFAYWHIPPYNVGARHYTQQGSFREITALFDGRIDWVFNGHEHMYQRMKPLRYNATLVSKYGRLSTDGVGYLVVPASGTHAADQLVAADDLKGYYRDRLVYPMPQNGETGVPSENGFVKVSLDGKTITIQHIGYGTHDAPLEPKVLDTLSYSRP